MKKVKLKLGIHSYDILIGSGLLNDAGQLLKENGLSGKVVVITDTVVRKHYGSVLRQSLVNQGFKGTVLAVKPGEEQKSLDSAGSLYCELGKVSTERGTPIVALGGGVVGDLAGFVAATYKRGVPFVQIPTTLLAQIDSSIGGKVAVNHGQLKNEIGVFYQPLLVISDVAVLGTLPEREICNGLAEIIKYGVIKDGDFFTYLEKNMEKIKLLDAEVLEEVVYRSATIKAEIVEKDERDTGLRNILNYGHTVGHALETVSNFKMGHGEAVAVGMLVAGRVASEMGVFSSLELGRLRNIIQKAGLPLNISGINVDNVVQIMKHDKKVLQGKVRFVLPKTIGEVFVTDKVDINLIKKVLNEFNQGA